jgi:hypothetical protein
VVELQTLAALGEFVGGIGGLIAAIAVVASLVFVGVQIKASVRQASVDSYSTITTLWADFTNAVAGNQDTWRVFYEGIRDYDALSDPDRSRFNFLIGMYFGIVDTVMVHENLGVWENPETYQRVLEEAYRVFTRPGVQCWWRQHQGRVFAPRVEAYLLERFSADASFEGTAGAAPENTRR